MTFKMASDLAVGEWILVNVYDVPQLARIERTDEVNGRIVIQTTKAGFVTDNDALLMVDDS